MKIVIPIAGRGSKFIAEGYQEIKPFISIKDKPMIQWATDALPFLQFNRDLIFIVRDDHVRSARIDEKLKKLYGQDITIVVTTGVTEGAACSVLLAKDQINNDEELIIYNADQYFKNDIAKMIQDKPADVKGIIPFFRAMHQRWSYILLDDDGYVVKTSEKEPLSNAATVGLYYFTKGSDFVWAAESMIKKNLRVQGEFYICPVYNELIGRGDKILAHEIKTMWSLGTPEDVEHFKKYYR